MSEAPDRLPELRERHEELVLAMRETGYDVRPPRRRDRNGFFNVVMHGSRDDLERIRPQWREYKRIARKAGQVEAEIDAVVHQKVEGEAGYRALVAEADKAANARSSCSQLIAAIRAAQRRIDDANATPATASRDDVKRDAKEVSKRLTTVRRGVDELKANLADQHSFEPGDLAELHIGQSGGREQYADVEAALDRLDDTAKALLRELAKRQREIKGEQRRYLKDGKARYDR